MASGSNLPAVLEFNLAVVLDAIRRSSEGASRSELARSTGLSAQTMTNLTRRLLDQDLIIEAGRQATGRGKPRTMLRLNAAGRHAIGVHLDPAFITCVLLDLNGRPVAHRRCATPQASAPAQATTDIVADHVRELRQTLMVENSRIVGLGVAAPGTLDSGTGTIIAPPLMPSWRNYHVADSLAAATGLEVTVTKDVVAATLAERWNQHSDPKRNFVFLYYGTGIGLGYVLNDELYVGATGNAGDAGHIIVDPSSTFVCKCGRRGCFGDVVTPARLVEQAVAIGLFGQKHSGEVKASLESAFGELTNLAIARNAGAVSILNRAASNTAVFLINLANLLDIERVVFGGPFWTPGIAERLLTAIPHLMRDPSTNNVGHDVEIRSSAVGEDVAAVGAACSVLDSAFSPHSTRLLIA